MNYNGWFHRGRLPDADIETLHKTDLIQPHPQWSDYYQWELEIEPELLDRRLRELQLEQLDRAEAILKTSHDILYAKLRENPETFIETLRVYFFRALKNFKHRYFSGNLPDCLRRYEPDDFFQEFFASISKMKYGDWEGFIQHTINENWDDGRFMGYFSRFLRQFFPGREAGDFNCLTYTLRRSLAKILENKTACEMSFDRIQDPDGTVYFVPENGKSQDADFGPLKQELEDVFAEHRKKLNKRLPGTLYYKKDAQDHARFQIHVPDLKPLVETVFHTLKQPLSKEQLVEYFSERYGLFEWRLGSLDDETKREVARSDSLSQTNDPEGEGISRRIRVHLVDSLEPLFRMIREFRRNGQGIVRAYAVDDTGERISRKQLGAPSHTGKTDCLTAIRSNKPILRLHVSLYLRGSVISGRNTIK